MSESCGCMEEEYCEVHSATPYNKEVVFEIPRDFPLEVKEGETRTRKLWNNHVLLKGKIIAIAKGAIVIDFRSQPFRVEYDPMPEALVGSTVFVGRFVAVTGHLVLRQDGIHIIGSVLRISEH
jgi:hypothetical protein